MLTAVGQTVASARSESDWWVTAAGRPWRATLGDCYADAARAHHM
jgi:hypothetical protein